MATDACRGGHVKVNGSTAKPATAVRIGDRVAAHAGGRQRELEIVAIIDKRVSAPAAAACVLDRSPPPPEGQGDVPAFIREPSAGRPTKRDRRQLDRLRHR